MLVTPPAWNDDDGTFSVTHHMFGYAPKDRVLEAGASMSRNHHQINSRPVAFVADFFDHRAGVDFRFEGIPRRKLISKSSVISSRARAFAVLITGLRPAPNRSTAKS